jgi:tetratricopeptide (TPR) repeat protein
MTVRGALACVAMLLSGAVANASPWDDIAHPNRRRCAQLVDEAGKLADQRRTKEAIGTARTAAALCPSNRGVLQRAGELLLDAHLYDEGRRDLERARLVADATTAPTRDQELSLSFLLGFAREVTGDVAGALEEHRRLEAMGGLPPPNQYLVHYDLGDELMASGRLTDAIDEYRRAMVTAPPTKSVVRLALAVALDRDEEVDEARTELAAFLAFDPELRSLGTDEYVFVPREDIYYYRAIALYERGDTAESRFDLRRFLAELPSSPYAARARERLSDAERHVDPREIEPSMLGAARQNVASAVGPLVGALEDCLPGPRLTKVRFHIAGGRIAADPQDAAADCLDRVLSRADGATLALPKPVVVTVPLAGRRGAPSLP